MREVLLSALPEGAVEVIGSIAYFELPNPDDPLKPFRGTAMVEGSALHLFPDRSSLQKRFITHHGL